MRTLEELAEFFLGHIGVRHCHVTHEDPRNFIFASFDIPLDSLSDSGAPVI
jgi:hypothetical protein